MKTTVLNQPDVQAFYKEHFLVFPVDVEGDVEMVDFEGHTTTMKDWATKVHRVRATPVFAFFDLNGNRVTRYIGATSDAAEFLLLGKYVVEGAMWKPRLSGRGHSDWSRFHLIYNRIGSWHHAGNC